MMMKFRTALQFAAIILLGTWTWAQEAPRAELSFDYSWARINPGANYTQWHALNGGGGAIKFNIGQIFGIKADLQGYNSNTTTFTIPANSTFPHGVNGSVSGNLFTYLFGPEFKFRAQHIQPYFNVLLGAAHTNVYGNAFQTICQPVAGACTGISGTPVSNAFALSTGVGLDVPVNRRVQIKVGEFDYLYTDFKNAFSSAGQNNFVYKGGLVINLGLPSLRTPTAACTVEPTELLPWGGPVKATVTPTDFNPKHTLTFGWESSGGTAVGQGNTATVNTEQLAPGQYSIRASVTDPRQKKNNVATCTASFTIRQPRAPVVTCSASPSTVKPGEPITVTVSGSSPDLSAIDRRSFSASAGALKEGQTQKGDQPGSFTTTGTLDTTNVPPGPINVSVNVTDVHGLSTTCTASAEVAAPPAPPPPPPPPMAQSVGKCQFKDKGSRVDNECKAILDGAAMQVMRDTGSRLIIVGYADSTEAKVKNLAAIRAANVRDYLTGGDGKQQIDASRTEIRTSADTNSGKVADVIFAPQDAQTQLEGTTVIDESTLPKKRAGKKH
jgi:outer membrane protein OmpA-like peptidoglycan-associated protein